ncbi:MAG TPA: thiamine-phosphate kinase [Thermosulfurimonas dismutans]|uniref:Thiamine-monophosphate kinase n=1 Tax=Thermosulfurimonas dismutans TaxID=999894 RepID=A0A7C3CG09_9BACT|nr:thiamine-phosphate kinase [Thermosulfurimonas dismutans]
MTEERFLELVSRYLRQAPPAVRTAEEDCAVLEGGRVYRLFTADALVEGVHFRSRYFPARALGWKLAAVNLSDLAAMGGRPEGALLILGLPRPPEPPWIEDFYGGLIQALSTYGADLYGGDTVRSPVLWAGLFLFGEASRPVFRRGGRAGDLIFVSRPLGGAAAALRYLESGHDPPEPLRRCLLFPEPEIELGRLLAEEGLATAMMDLSDGLLLDLYRLCRASRVGAALEEIPIAEGATEKDALSGGEDYALLFTVPPEKARHLPRLIPERRLYRIGHLLPETGTLLYRGKPISPRGFDHFEST